jgi:hypothetical protein
MNVKLALIATIAMFSSTALAQRGGPSECEKERDRLGSIATKARAAYDDAVKTCESNKCLRDLTKQPGLEKLLELKNDFAKNEGPYLKKYNECPPSRRTRITF